MTPLDVIWVDGPDGNVQHVAEHGVTVEEVQEVLAEPIAVESSRATGRPIAFGFTAGGRFLAVVYEEIGPTTVYPLTAYEVED